MAREPLKRTDEMSIAELEAEVLRLKESLCDIEDTHAFTFGKTSVHIGAEKAQAMQDEYEEECRLHRDRIAQIEAALKARRG